MRHQYLHVIKATQALPSLIPRLSPLWHLNVHFAYINNHAYKTKWRGIYSLGMRLAERSVMRAQYDTDTAVNAIRWHWDGNEHINNIMWKICESFSVTVRYGLVVMSLCVLLVTSALGWPTLSTGNWMKQFM